MKKTFIVAIIAVFISLPTFSQKIEAYRIFDKNGKEVSMKKMLKELELTQIILFGEFHNNTIAHWLQFEISNYLSEKHKLILGAEMFEADNQADLTRYVRGEIDKPVFDSLVRLWPNYETDYAPLVLLAKKQKLDFIATNIPRVYAKLVNQEGLEALELLSDEEKAWIAPLPISFDPELSCYKKMTGMMMGKGSANLPKAQAIKDATMAHFILKNYKEGYIFMHFNGSYHSDYYEGILWYLKREKPELKYTTITTVSQNYVDRLYDDNIGIADFIICVDNDMTNTY